MEHDMVIVETICGNVKDPGWETTLRHASVDWLVMNQWEAQKSRCRMRTQNGIDLAVSLPRGTLLRDGDVLVWDGLHHAAIVARVILKEVMVVHLKALEQEGPEIIVRTCVELGHALGNQHWPAVVKGSDVYVPMTVDQKVMASVMKTHAFQGVTYEFIPGSEAIPFLAPHEARRLFGGAEDPLQAHRDQPHAHPHVHPHTHDHVDRQ
jgi:urease accessory protein